MSRSDSFELNAFNVLPSPNIDSDSRDDDPETLAKVFSYLFKPNRAIAWCRDRDTRWYPAETDVRWLIRLPSPDRGSGPVVFVALGTQGAFTLWSYDIEPSKRHKGAGLTRLELEERLENTGIGAASPRIQSDADALILTRFDHESSSPSRHFQLERFLCACDADGDVRLRIFTARREHRIDLDFSKITKNVVPYSHRFVGWKQPLEPRQVGGWAGDAPVYWAHPARSKQPEKYPVGRLLTRRGRREQTLEGLRPGAVVRAAASSGTWIAAGGDDDCLWIGEIDDRVLRLCRKDSHLRGHIRSLAMLERSCSRSPLILAGADEHYLHVFDCCFHRLQKVDMGGTVEAILPLSSDNNDSWFDVAVAVRDMGLMCVRLLADRFKISAAFRPDQEQKDQFISLLKCRYFKESPGNIEHLLRSKITSEQLLGYVLLLHPSKALLEWFRVNADVAKVQPDIEVVRWVVHTVKRRIDVMRDTASGKDDALVAHYLSLLKVFAQGAHRTRQAVMHLQAWLLDLEDWVEPNARAREAHSDLIGEYADAKRLLRRWAEESVKLERSSGGDAAKETLGRVASLVERLQFKRLFSEVILAPKGQRGRIDASALVSTDNDHTIQVFGRRGEPGLQSFTTRYSTTEIYPETRNGNRRAIQGSDQEVRGLTVVGTNRFIARSTRNASVVNLANGGAEESVVWPPSSTRFDEIYPDRLAEITAVAIAGDGGGESMIALGLTAPAGPSARAASSPSISAKSTGYASFSAKLAVTRLDSGIETSQRIRLRLDTIGCSDPRIMGLDWESDNCLWGVTNGPGCLIRWQCQNKKWSEQLVLTVGSSQRCIQVLAAPDGETSIFLGGEDGVLRKFDREGRLDWARMLPGGIRGLSLCSPAGDQKFAQVAVITERATLALFDNSGKHHGFLEFPGDPLTSLASGSVSPAKIQHHLVGTLWGNLRLVEEVSESDSADPLRMIRAQGRLGQDETYHSPAASEVEHWDEIRRSVRSQLDRLIAERNVLHDWLEYDAADREPLRACWAARNLISLPQIGPGCVLPLLKELSKRDDPQARELRAHVFGVLGEHFAQISGEDADAFIEVWSEAKDGALASLLSRIPSVIEDEYPLLKRLLEIVWKRVVAGRPFVSSALLQRLHDLPNESGNPFDPLVKLMDRIAHGKRGVHPGFVQGLLSVVLKKLNYSEQAEERGIIGVFSNLGGRHGRLEHAIANTGRPDRGILLELIDRHASVLFTDEDHRVWNRIFPCLSAPPDQVHARLRETVRDLNHLRSEHDLFLLRSYLQLFPGESIVDPESWRATTLQDIGAFTNQLRKDLEKIKSLSPGKSASLELVADLKDRIPLARQPIALLANIHAAWSRAWSDQVAAAEEYVNEFDTDEGKGSIPEEIWRVFRIISRLQAESGILGETTDSRAQSQTRSELTPGHYYRIRYAQTFGDTVVGQCVGQVELCYVDEPENAVNGTSRPPNCELSGELAKRAWKYQTSVKPSEDILVYELIPSSAPEERSGPRPECWKDYPGGFNVRPRIEIPVLRKVSRTERSEDGSEATQYRAEGIFVFEISPSLQRILKESDPDTAPRTPEPQSRAGMDRTESGPVVRGTNPVGSYLRRVPPPLQNVRTALCRVTHGIKLQERRDLDQAHKHLNRLERGIAPLTQERDILAEILKIVVRASRASSGLLFLRPASGRGVAVIGEYQRSPDLFETITYLDEVPDVPGVMALDTGDHLSILDLCSHETHDVIRSQFLQNFERAGKEEAGRQWFDEQRSVVAIPLEVGGKAVGALSVYSRRVAGISENDFKAIRSLVLTSRWIAHSARLNELMTNWIFSFVHEMRTDAMVARQAAHMWMRYEEDRDEHFAVIENQLQNSIALLSNVLDTRERGLKTSPHQSFSSPGEISRKLVELYRLSHSVTNPVFSVDPPWNSSVWTAELRGDAMIFERVMRNLVDNAAKYGPSDIVLRAKCTSKIWSIEISNPGEMTGAEYRVRFDAFLKPIDARRDGAHVGLAASKKLVEANGGSLSLENETGENGARVCARVEWPLAKSE